MSYLTLSYASVSLLDWRSFLRVAGVQAQLLQARTCKSDRMSVDAMRAILLQPTR
jgi:hypothetical protein